MTKIELFHHLMELPAGARSMELARLRLDDPVMAAQLDELIQAESAPEERWFAALPKLLANVLVRSPQVAGYEPVSLLGTGGMGEVWRARRVVADTSQWVALKLLKHDQNNQEAIRRFRLEQHTLLRLDHPHIARLLDAGIAADGRPWIAMELVEGIPITRYCDQFRLGTRQRIALFEQMLAAVQHAHDLLFVHRDIKPENVLVSGDGVVKLLDFGISKSLDGYAAGALTQRYFSPSAAAPEQVLGQDISVQTDVYGLGCLLYELLCGATVWDSESLTPAQLERLIVEATPTAPSKRASDGVAQSRNLVDARALAQALRGELDRIVLHALRKKPAERYGSARLFNDDLRAFLEHRPVRAVGQNSGYRLRKLLRRHWLLASVVSAALFALLLLTTVLALQSQELRRATALAQRNLQQAEAQREDARRAQAESEAVNEFLVNVFKRADPRLEGRGMQGLDVLVDASLEEVRKRNLTADSNVALLLALARGLVAIGKSSRAESLLEEVLQRADLRAAERRQARFLLAETAWLQRDAARLRDIVAQLDSTSGSLNDAERMDLRGIKARIASLAEDHHAVIEYTAGENLKPAIAYLRADAQIELAQFDAAQQTLGRALERDPSASGRLSYMRAMSRISQERGAHDAELAIRVEALNLAREILGNGHSAILGYQNDVASSMLRAGRFADAEQLFRAVQEQARKDFKADDRRHDYLRFNIALALAKQGKLDAGNHARLVTASAGGTLGLHLSAANALARDAFLKQQSSEFQKRTQELRRFDPALIASAQSSDQQNELERKFWVGVTDAAANPVQLTIASKLARFDPIFARISHCLSTEGALRC